MYKLQIVNALTKDIVREKTYRKADLVLSLLESATKGQLCFLFDEDCRTYKGDYVSHECYTEEGFVIYKVYFKLQLSEIQARVTK